MDGEGPTALIGAYEPGPGPGGLRSLLPLAGMSVVEHQARRAIEAGAARVLLLIDEAPSELSEAIARLRHDGNRLSGGQQVDYRLEPGSIRTSVRSRNTQWCTSAAAACRHATIASALASTS